MDLNTQYKKGLESAESDMVTDWVSKNITIELGTDENQSLSKLGGLMKIVTANGLSKVPDVLGIPWFHNETEFIDSFSDGNEHCLSIILKSLPVPDEKTPWEAILDFRNNEESIAKRKALINWQNKICRQKLSSTEIADELDYCSYCAFPFAFICSFPSSVNKPK